MKLQLTRRVWTALFAAFWGALAFLGVSSNPRFATIHVLDVMRLMLVGAAIAVALMSLFFNPGAPSEANSPGEESRKEPK